MTANEFVRRWTERGQEFGRLRVVVDGQLICEEVLADFGSVLQGVKDELVCLEEAAVRSGYSPDHLRRLHAQGKLHAERQGRRLFFRVGDLPRKPDRFDDPPTGGYDPVADARQVAAVRNRGGKR